MTKYTVTLTQAHIRYTETTVEVEAETETDAATLAKSDASAVWTATDGEDPGYLDIEVSNDESGSVGWRED